MTHPFAKERLALALLARELHDLMPEDEARALEAELAQALREDTHASLARATQRALATPARERLQALLGSDEKGLRGLRGIPSVSGDSDPVAIQKYVCPRGCHYVRYRFFAEDPIPQCPEHHIPLVPEKEVSC